MNPTFVSHLVAATEDVFATMVFKPVTAEAPIEGLGTSTGAHVVASVAFAGQCSGMVAFHSGVESAKAIAGSMLGMEPGEVDGEMPDAIGEITNMIAGGFRLKLTGDGLSCAISVPTVITGSDFKTKYVTPVTRVLCPFQFNGDGRVFVELILTQ